VDNQFQSIFNIQPIGDAERYSSREEGISTRNAQLIYLNYQIAEEEVDQFHISAFCTKLKLLPAPTYVHGDDLEKAALLCLIDHALKNDWSADEASVFVEKQALSCCREPWTSRLREIIEAA